MNNSVQKLKINTVASVINQAATIISGFIIPRLILSYFGSGTNGLVSSINQFLAVITFLDLGVGSVVQASLYRPLAQNDTRQASLVLSSAQRFFRNIARTLAVYVVILIFLFPLAIDRSLPFLPTAFLIFSLSLNQMSNFYFGMVNQILVRADQRDYVQLFSQAGTTILNLIASVILIVIGLPIHWVKFASGLLFLLRPLYLQYYVRKNYELSTDLDVKGQEPIKQKWNGMLQHIAYTVTNSTDIVVLSVLSTLHNVSIYSVYNMVVGAIRVMIEAVTDGLKSFYGGLLARDEYDRLNSYFARIEWGVHTLASFLYSMTMVLIVSFVMIYTSGVDDANYNQPLFAAIFVMAQFMLSARVPYTSLILSAGHFKQTQWASGLEAVINIIISLIMVFRFGLVGVAIGTLISVIYRTVYSAWYLSTTILNRPLYHFFKQLFIDIGFAILFLLITTSLPLEINGLISWILAAIVYGVIGLVLSFVINLIFYRTNVQFITSSLWRRIKK